MPKKVKDLFSNINYGANVIIEPTSTFLSPCHCTIVDRFGIMWQINCPK